MSIIRRVNRGTAPLLRHRVGKAEALPHVRGASGALPDARNTGARATSHGRVTGALIALLIGVCSASAPTYAQRPDAEGAPNWDEALALPTAPDLNPDPRIVE